MTRGLTCGLCLDDFGAFFRAAHDCAPFPWQERLARLVCTDGWPQALDVPTGAGKTATIDIAVFHLALEADRGAERRAPVRILFVVDRRLVVDDAYARARRLATALAKAREGILGQVARRLGLLAERAETPLLVAKLRGGVPKEPDWVRTPAQPVVAVSTVDQVGSRLLFRGYGVSDTMKPVHAGLLGADSLVLLDEAHLSRPFVQSVQDSRKFQVAGPWSDDVASSPFGVVTLSATQSEKAAPLVSRDDLEHPVLGPRLTSSKFAELVMLEDDCELRLVEELARRALDLSRVRGGAASVVAIVVNRVRRARAVFAKIEEDVARPSRERLADCALLTGRSRPLEREEVLRDLLPRVAAQRTTDGASPERPVFVVATQCVEAGADLDFDALVTEIAPIDSLRQRFGRLNRMGRFASASAVVVATPEQVSARRSKPDPVYGEALRETWSLLTEHARTTDDGRRTIDFGVEGARRWLPVGPALAKCLAPQKDAPVLLAAFVEQWVCTSPVPAVDPDISLFLHGARSSAEIQVVWRADVTAEDPVEVWVERLHACPPSALESLSLPIAEFCRWMQGSARGDVTDLEVNDDEDVKFSTPKSRAVRWFGADDERSHRFAKPSDLRPGDVVVVPSESGGCDRWGWSPDHHGPVRDLGSEANRQQRARDILRLSTRLLQAEMVGSDVEERVRRFESLLDGLRDATTKEVQEALAAFRGLPAAWSEWLSRDGGPLRTIWGRRAGASVSERIPMALERRVSVRSTLGEATGDAVTEDDDSAVAALRAVHLDDHSKGVRDLATSFAAQCGLPAAVAKDVALAAFLHDAGKAHPAFKCWLYGGDELAAVGGKPLAKSGRRLGERARTRAGLPKGARHEVASLAFAEAHPRFREANDPELVLWLIGTHHGWGRPLFPPVQWPEAGCVFTADLGDGDCDARPAMRHDALGARWLDLETRLRRRYGPWGLARLEAIVRLADHRRSEAEQE